MLTDSPRPGALKQVMLGEPTERCEILSTECEDRDLGFVVAVTGSMANVRLHKSTQTEDGLHRITVGRLVAIHRGTSYIIGVVARVSSLAPTTELPEDGSMVAEVDFLGEISYHDTPKARFQRGVTNYPSIGDGVVLLRRDELSLIHRVAEGGTIEVGTLQLDQSLPAYINFDELLRKHFAILGTTGVGKSTSVALILREIVQKKANLRIFLIDPHNEYGACFGDEALVLNPKNLRLPFWLFNFEEIIDVIFRGRPGVEEETEILSEVISVAKAQYAAYTEGERIQLRKGSVSGFTADTPLPYRISDVVAQLDQCMGKLENRSSWVKYSRLIARLETLGNDSRYAFMFNGLLIGDIMVEVLGELFRLPPNGKAITVMQLAGFPAEVVDSVVSVLCRMAFDFGVWSDGAVPILVACEEAHRYAPADRRLGFGPTRKALSRIAKEGRKYGVFLGAITQRPAELDATILSQCSTVFAMRMANDRDQAIVKAAVPDAGGRQIEFLASLGIREAIAFGEGVALPTRIRFKDLAQEFVPRSQSGRKAQLDASGVIYPAFMQSVVDRWRQTTMAGPRPRAGLVPLEQAVIPVVGLSPKLQPRKMD
jgi:DNA helicase HerA-like ATPase